VLLCEIRIPKQVHFAVRSVKYMCSYWTLYLTTQVCVDGMIFDLSGCNFETDGMFYIHGW
jgi:hypothetical protein